ncbi:MAG: hypothetical protein WAU69_06395 [Solirubrobacteraceae bacterium]
MRSIKMVGVAIVAVLALGAMTAGSASAFTKFVASKTGGQLNGKAINTQKFKTGGGATVDCTVAEPSGEVTKLEGTEQESSVKYSSCTVSGLGSAEVTLADYTFFITPLVSVLNLIHIKATALGVECELSVLAGQSFTGIEYENDKSNAEEIVVKSKVTGIVTDILKSNSSSLCGTAGTEVTNGTYEGEVLVGLSNGSIKVS